MKNDPCWLVARRNGTCQGKDCKDPIRVGDRIFWYPLHRTPLVGRCAEAASRDFEAHRQDEETMSGAWGAAL